MSAHTPAPWTVAYEGQIPASLRRYADAHAARIAEVAHGSGYATKSGYSYDVLLRAGWRFGECHTVYATTAAEVIRALRSIRACDCEDCVSRIAKAEARP